MRIETLYDRYRAELLQWAAGMTQSRAVAEDLVQDAFCRALQNESLFATLDERQARAWLYRTVKNRFIDTVRKQSREQLVEELPETAQPATDFSEIEWKLLFEALPYPDGTLLWLHAVNGLTGTELAKQFGLPPGTVRSKLFYARKRLYQILGGTNHV